MDEILNEFIIESTEALDSLDVELVELEQNPGSTPTLSSIFRRIHTIKGTCGFLGFSRLERVTHVGENLLSRLRDGELTVTPEITSALLEMTDVVRSVVDLIASTGDEGDGDYSALETKLAHLTEHGSLDAFEGDPEATAGAEPEPSDAAAASDETASNEAEDDVQVNTGDRGAPAGDDESSERPAASGGLDIDLPDNVRVGGLLLQAKRITKEQLDAALASQTAGDPRHVGELLVEMGAITSDDIVAVLNAQKSQAAATAVTDSSIRVDVTVLDELMNLVGELVLARNQILQFTNAVDDSSLVATTQRLDLITTELQGSVMKTRMQPIENAWAKFPRIVRDLSRQCGKEVRLETYGGETELDKTLLEAIRDPLTHVVRNAVDHGIEEPDVRESRGKSREGRLSLRAFHESGQVNIEISDDGGGINPARVKDTAIARGVVTSERAERMSDRELIELIFAPGFSTAEKVTNVSGRGVGMDVVRTNIEQIGGTIDLQSQVGLGTTMRIKIPLTLAIIPALIVTSGDDQYAIPQVNLLELVRLDREEAAKSIEHVHGAPVYRLRGKLLPLVFLNDQLGMAREQDANVNIVVLQAGERNFGLVVDRINDTAEIVVKPLGKVLKGLAMFAGATIMGDGTVALILDVAGLAEQARLSTDGQHAAVAKTTEQGEDGDVRRLLLFTVGSDHRYAISLSDVARLEEFKPEDIERSGNLDVVQYRDEILPLVYTADVLEPGARAGRDPDGLLQVVVYRHNDADVGLVVERITDIVEQAMTVTRKTTARGLAGSAVIQGKVTDLVDVDGLLAAAGVALTGDPVSI